MTYLEKFAETVKLDDEMLSAEEIERARKAMFHGLKCDCCPPDFKFLHCTPPFDCPHGPSEGYPDKCFGCWDREAE